VLMECHQIIPTKHLKLTREIGSGPGYFIHAGENKGRAVIVKVFNAGPNVREVRRVIGRKSPSSNTRRSNWILPWLCQKDLCEREPLHPLHLLMKS
jgi:hypothetical protein